MTTATSDLLAAPVRRCVGDKTAKGFAQLDVHTIGDLLHHYPRRYYERGELADLSALVPGEHVTVQARVGKVGKPVHVRERLVKLDVDVTDGRSTVRVTFFNARWLAGKLHVGDEVLLAGTVDEWRGRPRFTHPELRVGGDADEFAGALIPVYPASASLSSWNIAKAVGTALDLVGELPDPLPDEVRRRRGLVDLTTALRLVHRPQQRADHVRARARLRYDEAFLLQVALAQRRAEASGRPAVPRAAAADGLLDAFDRQLPFELTAGQRAVAAVIADEVARHHPMHRLLQGEVGSGKTIVAVRAMLTVVDAGGQAAMLAPTEVLAAQHYRSIRELLGPLGAAGELGAADPATRVALLTGSTGAARRRTLLDEVAAGEIGIVVGTHALLEEDVRFADLGLVVVDEQHRFGVHQRDALRGKGDQPPHLLVMTATPIPRTVAMTVFGDLETSTLTELPAGRSGVQTFVVPAGNPAWVERMWGRVRDEVAAGHQAFVVCPRIGDDGADPETAPDADPDSVGDEVARTGPRSASEARTPATGAAVLDVWPRLAEEELRGLRVEALHGRLTPEAKDAVMRRFAAGETDVLVATTVIEVGVDVPNATVMAILDADRFGVSQLHQLRGRVGRGSAASWCLLHTMSEPDTPAGQRLAAVAATGDGFELARLDLEQRREGNVLGVEQSGRHSLLKLLRLTRDEEVVLTARDDATDVVAADPGLVEHPVLRAALDERLGLRADFLAKA